MKLVPFNHVAIVGVGLIGGSLALCARQQGLFKHTVGIGRSLENLQKAKALNVVDAITRDLHEGVNGADLIVIATPVSTIVPIMKTILPSLKKGALITDVGSVKGEIVEAADNLPLSETYFVAGHPIAGTENSGAGAAFPELFQGKKCILTPSEKTNPDALEKVKALWLAVGAEVMLMDSARHDRILGAVSHLPHMIAFALITYLNDLRDEGEGILKFSGGGLRDFTRIAGSHPIMWKDIALMNKNNLVRLIEGYQKELDRLKKLIQTNDEDPLVETLEKSRSIRRELIG